MKTLFILITGILTIVSTEAQQLVALTKVSAYENHSNRSIKKKNSDYLAAVLYNESSNEISNLRKEVANYNIRSFSIFDDSEPATYEVTFRKGNNHILVTYDNGGAILSSKETYNNVPLPVDLRIAVSKQFPGWEFAHTKFQLSYERYNKSQSTYAITLKKGKKKMTLTGLTSQ
jgi:hypothetical protein